MTVKADKNQLVNMEASEMQNEEIKDIMEEIYYIVAFADFVGCFNENKLDIQCLLQNITEENINKFLESFEDEEEIEIEVQPTTEVISGISNSVVLKFNKDSASSILQSLKDKDASELSEKLSSIVFANEVDEANEVSEDSEEPAIKNSFEKKMKNACKNCEQEKEIVYNAFKPFDTLKIELESGETYEFKFAGVSYTPWSKVNKADIRVLIKDLYLNAKNKSDVDTLAKIVFAHIKCTDNAACFKFPIAEVNEVGKNKYEVKINVNGLKTALVFLQMPSTVKAYDKETISKIAKNLKQVYEWLQSEGYIKTIPEYLKNIENFIATITNMPFEITFDIEKLIDEDKISDEDYALFQALTSVLNALGFVQIESEDDSETILQIKADENTINKIRDFVNLFKDLYAKIFDESKEKIISSSSVDSDDYELLKNAYEELLRKYEHIEQQNKQYEQMLKENQELVEKYRNEITELKNAIEKHELADIKLNLIADLLQNTEFRNIVFTIMDAESKEELKAFNKIANSLFTQNGDNKIELKLFNSKLNLTASQTVNQKEKQEEQNVLNNNNIINTLLSII